MKKTLLALTVAAVATSAQAQIELYKDDSSSVKVKGQIATFLYMSDKDYKDPATADTKTDPDVTIWAKTQFDFQHQVTDTLVAGGTFEIQSGTGYDNHNNDAEFDDVAAYLKGDFGVFGIGEIGDVADADDAVSKTDILNELDNNYVPVGVGSDSQGNGLVYRNVFGPVTATVDAFTKENEEESNVYGVSFDYAADMFSIGANYRVQSDSNTTVGGNDQSQDSWAIAADVTPIDALTLAAAYNVYTKESATGELETQNLTFSASFAATESLALYGVYGQQDQDDHGTSTKNAQDIVLGSSYAVSSLLDVFAEVGSYEAQNEDQETKILLGAYLNF
ncbi:hypothetical protein L1D54_23015 [Vibrio brasiliensis]|uniref:porin n=1 Tax=Vibrio brasiliensis TaxID=170652 RepID=UPI001EFC82AE|nr:hypothetical protein [Vibrio brasiliensis]MCG9753317.1 hypothetical protein [Vibrio brasiliensis]